MALKFAKKAKDADAAAGNEAEGSSPPKSEAPKSAPKLSFMKKGTAAKAALAHEEAKAEERKAEAGKMRRYFVKQDSEGQVTFLDGKLDGDGMLDINMFYEHRIKLNGDWHNFVCTADVDQTQPCPICEKGDKPSFVGVMTVLDHSSYTVKSGPNAGKTYTNQRRLFVAKRNTINLLTKLAAKRGGLAGCTFDVLRGGDKTPAVGEQFDFVEKHSKLSEIADKYDLKLEDVQPAKYDEEITFRTPEQLIELGIGKATVGVGHEKGVGALADEL
jgi:hypothetical protein